MISVAASETAPLHIWQKALDKKTKRNAWGDDVDYGTETRKMRTESDSSSDRAKGYEAKAGRKWGRTSPGSRGQPRKAGLRVRLWKIPGESPAGGRQG